MGCMQKDECCGKFITLVRPWKHFYLLFVFCSFITFTVFAVRSNPDTIHTGIFTCEEIDCRVNATGICLFAGCNRCLVVDDCDGDCHKLTCEDPDDSYEEQRPLLNYFMYAFMGICGGGGMLLWPICNAHLAAGEYYPVFHVYDDCIPKQRKPVDSAEAKLEDIKEEKEPVENKTYGTMNQGEHKLEIKEEVKSAESKDVRKLEIKEDSKLEIKEEVKSIEIKEHQENK